MRRKPLYDFNACVELAKEIIKRRALTYKKEYSRYLLELKSPDIDRIKSNYLSLKKAEARLKFFQFIGDEEIIALQEQVEENLKATSGNKRLSIQETIIGEFKAHAPMDNYLLEDKILTRWLKDSAQ